MLDFEYHSPTCFVFGRDKEKETGGLVRRFGGTKVIVIYGGESALKSGLIARIEASLEAAGIPSVLFGGIRPNPKSGPVYEAIDICRKNNCDFILAAGGGSVIDTAKAVAAGVAYEGDFLELWDSPIKAALPVGTVLTIPAAGSEASPNTVITDERTGIKRGTKSDLLRPLFSVLNPALTFTLPPEQTAFGITDMMSHVLERYFTTTDGVEITDCFCEAVLKTVICEGTRVMADGANYNARANLMWASSLAHSNICGVGRTQDWTSHALSHALSSLYDTAHGAALAVMFPAWMQYVLDRAPARFARLAANVWGVDEKDPVKAAKEGILRFRGFLSSIGMPSSFADIGAKKEDIPSLLSHVFKFSDTVGTFARITSKDAEKIYLSALFKP